MATRTESAASDLYDEDFHVWAGRQAALLRARRFEDLDLANLIEEIDDLAGARWSAVQNSARVVMEHLLKLQHGPATDPRNGRRATVREHRSRLEVDLTPRLRRMLAEGLPHIYDIARRNAAGSMRDHGEHAAAGALPETCPYGLDRITDDWLP